MVLTQKSQEIGIKLTITHCPNFDKQCSGAHFVSFLLYYYCTSRSAYDAMSTESNEVKINGFLQHPNFI